MRLNETEAHCDWLVVCRKSQIPASSFILQFKITVCEISDCLTWTHRTGNSPNYQFTCGFCILETKTGDKNPNWQWCEDKRQIQEWRVQWMFMLSTSPWSLSSIRAVTDLSFCFWENLKRKQEKSLKQDFYGYLCYKQRLRTIIYALKIIRGLWVCG